MAISDLVVLSVEIQDSAPKVPSFSTLLVATFHAVAGQTGMQTFATGSVGLAAMITAGYTTKHDAYRKMAAISSQVPGVASVKFWKRAVVNAQSIELTPTVTTEGEVYTLDVNGTPIEYTVGASETVATICDGLTTLIDAVADVACADNTTKVTLTPSVASIRVYLDDCSRNLTVKDASTDAGIATDLANAMAADQDFFGVLIDSMAETEINAAGAWCLSNKRIGFFQTADTAVWSNASTDVLSDLSGATNHFAVVIPTRFMSDQACAAYPGKLFSYDPGTPSWAQKTLEGVRADDWTGAEQGYIQAKHGVAYVDSAGVKHTLWGWAASGRFIDLTHGTEWLAATMRADLVVAMTRPKKIPYNLRGRAVIEQVISTRLTIAESKELIEPGWIVTPPDLALISTIDKTNRFMPDFTFSGDFTGAVHKISVAGTLKA